MADLAHVARRLEHYGSGGVRTLDLDARRELRALAAALMSWPTGLEQDVAYQVACDDKGRNGGSWMQVLVASDGDVHVSMQDWEDIPEGRPSTFPSIRVRTLGGGGRHHRTRLALLHLADAIRRDTEELGGGHG